MLGFAADGSDFNGEFENADEEVVNNVDNTVQKAHFAMNNFMVDIDIGNWLLILLYKIGF